MIKLKDLLLKEDFLKDVIRQIGQRTFRYVGAKNFVKGRQKGMKFIQFDVKGRKMKRGGRIIVYYNRGKDLYNVEGWVIRNLKAKKVVTKKDIDMSNLGDTIERITG